ncbi:MAG: diaminohydroxyphosphoribosylaminopyrimidine deaminase, partial [Alphaproteobacteria bacterium]|nr:diaminohydroxyphosphoribosylaminopyrimidine deaminase [Alphaproteobacteria bacterium]
LETPLWVIADVNTPRDDEAALRTRGVEILRVPSMNGKLYLLGALKLLAGCGITRLMVEAGPILAAALVEADLVDEAVLLRSPNAIGPDGIDALEGLPLEALTRSPRLAPAGTDTAGSDTIEYFWRPG